MNFESDSNLLAVLPILRSTLVAIVHLFYLVPKTLALKTRLITLASCFRLQIVRLAVLSRLQLHHFLLENQLQFLYIFQYCIRLFLKQDLDSLVSHRADRYL